MFWTGVVITTEIRPWPSDSLNDNDNYEDTDEDDDAE